ncbi:hypothetical protein, partial [Fibrobacter succinogenes]|uniref:hypothetical protein n=1 Tax=Fibrobacter succinogenes TaxID=833 RepID=UPI0026F1E82B
MLDEDKFAELSRSELELDSTFLLEDDCLLLLVMAASEPPSPCSMLEEDFALLDVMPDSVPASPFLLLLDTLVSLSLDCGVTLEEESSSRGAKLLSSSPHATKRASANPSKKRFMQIFLLFHH